MSDGAQREMTLEEWVDKLPEIHRAHKEYRKLRERVEELEREKHPVITVETRGTQIRLFVNGEERPLDQGGG